MSTDDNHGSPAFATAGFECRPDFSVEPGSFAAATGCNFSTDPNNP
jgi:hypothetical protein